MNAKQSENDRIKFDMPLPTVSLKVFIERALRDDEFFDLALESPLAAMKECHVNLDTSRMVASDIATFLGALASLKEIVKEKQIKDLTFEKVFGKPADIRGSVIESERNQGFLKEWDNREAHTERDWCGSTNKTFAGDRTGARRTLSEVVRERSIAELREQRVNITTESRRDWVAVRFESAETNNHTRTEWSNDASMQSDRRSDAGVNTTFEKDGKMPMEDALHGPLVNEVDIATISARLDAAAKVLK